MSTESASAPSVAFGDISPAPKSAVADFGTLEPNRGKPLLGGGGTIASLRRDLTARLEAAFASQGRTGTAALDARLLVAHALGIDPSRLALHDDEPVDAETEARARAFIESRIAGEPVARIVGHQEFWGLDLRIGPDTLVPRPDTETVVEAALAFVDASAGSGSSPAGTMRSMVEGAAASTESASAPSVAFGDTSPVNGGGTTESAAPLRGGGTRRGASRELPLRILDIGTGSGAILLALLSELPNATGIGTDRAPGALEIARANAARLGLASRARFVGADWASGVAGPFDLVVANPPYVRSGDIGGLEVEVSRHEPHLSLDGGADGLGAYRVIFQDIDRLLAQGARAFFEVGEGQAADVAALAGTKGFSTALHADLTGIPRVVEMWRSEDG